MAHSVWVASEGSISFDTGAIYYFFFVVGGIRSSVSVVGFTWCKS